MVTTTKARQLRRATQRFQETVIDKLLDKYTQNPNAALERCFDVFGRERFENALRVYLHQHVAKVAMELAVKHCMEGDHAK